MRRQEETAGYFVPTWWLSLPELWGTWASSLLALSRATAARSAPITRQSLPMMYTLSNQENARAKMPERSIHRYRVWEPLVVADLSSYERQAMTLTLK